jgi:hypothetical protein
MKKSFRLDEVIDLPKDISENSVSGKTLLIAASNPTWITVDEEELFVINNLIERKTLRESLIEHNLKMEIQEIWQIDC